MGKKGRLWCFTNYNLDFDYEEYLASGSAEYVLAGRETCPKTKKLHDQCFVYFSGARNAVLINKVWTSKRIAKELGNANCRLCEGNIDQNTDYCGKDEQVREFGIRPKQGERTDLLKIKEDI